MKHHALFSSKDKSKKKYCRLLQFLLGALKVKPQAVNLSTVVSYYLQGELTTKPGKLEAVDGDLFVQHNISYAVMHGRLIVRLVWLNDIFSTNCLKESFVNAKT